MSCYKSGNEKKIDEHTNIKLGNFIGRECPFPQNRE